MKKTLIFLIVIVVMNIGSIALAGENQVSANEARGPVMLTDIQLDNVVAAGVQPVGTAWGWWAADTTSDYLCYVPGNENKSCGKEVGSVSTSRPVYHTDYDVRSQGKKANTSFEYAP